MEIKHQEPRTKNSEAQTKNSAAAKSFRCRIGRCGWWGLFVVGFVAGGLTTYWFSPQRHASVTVRHRTDALLDANAADSTPSTEEVSMADVLRLAEAALSTWQAEVDDYTATLIKQESVGGVVGEPNEVSIKVQCRHRGPDRQETQPMRVYLRFDQPSGVAGREVIWCEDLHDGKLVAHEGGLMGLLTVRLDPTGMLAMRGQRYPITEIGLTNLYKQLVQRGEQDRDNPDVSVTRRGGLSGDPQAGSPASIDLIEVRRKQPSGAPDDFSLARIYFDNERSLPFKYEAYGWPAKGTVTPDADGTLPISELPLLESYAYLNLQTNVGLSDKDFDPTNPDYQYR